MRMNRFFLLLLIFLFIVVLQSFSVDFGGIIDNATSISGSEDYSFFQKDKLSLWFDAELGKALTFYIQGSYTYSIDRPYFFDLDSLSLAGKFPSVIGSTSLLNFNVGRFVFSDFSKVVLDHNADGLLLGLNYPFANISVSAGYTGLLFKQSSSIVISKADSSDTSREDVFLAPPRLIEAAQILFPELFLRQDLTLSFLAQQDLRSEDEIVTEGEEDPILAKGGKLNTQYMGLGLSGPIASSFYYDTYFYLGTGKVLSYLEDSDSGTGYSYQYKPVLSYLFGGGLRIYVEEALFSKIELKFLFSSGDTDYSKFIDENTEGSANNFVPISRPDLALIFSPQLGNVFLTELSYSLKPLSGKGYSALDNLQTILKAIAFFRPTSGPISEGGIDSDSEALYLGTEIDGIINFRPFSDLGIALSVGLFIPNSGSGEAFLEDQRELEVLGRLEFSFCF